MSNYHPIKTSIGHFYVDGQQGKPSNPKHQTLAVLTEARKKATALIEHTATLQNIGLGIIAADLLKQQRQILALVIEAGYQIKKIS